MAVENRLNIGAAYEPNLVIEAYKQDVDRALTSGSLKLTPEQRLR